MRVNLDPEVEDDEGNTAEPARKVPYDGLAVVPIWRCKVGYAKEEVGYEVVEEDHVYAVTEEDPDIPFGWVRLSRYTALGRIACLCVRADQRQSRSCSQT